jgi:hypothetical protein
MDGIKIEVTGNIARVIERPARITAGTVGLPVEFSFDNQWEGLSKTAVFKAGCTEMIVENLDVETIVPWEATANPNVWLSIGVYGVNADGSVAIPTIWANVCVICEGTNPEGDVSTAPTLPVWQRLWNSIGNLLGLTTNAKGNLVEAINEVNNIALAGGIESDTTLTKSGKAADAKATGDALNTKAASDHKHTASEVGARPDTWTPTASEVGARPDTWTPTATAVGAVPANYSTASAANGWHRAHFAKIGKMVTCSLIPVANRSEVLYGTSTTIPGGFAPAENISFKLYSNFNASHSGSGTVTLAVNKDGTITVSATNGVSLDELSGTYCWLTA